MFKITPLKLVTFLSVLTVSTTTFAQTLAPEGGSHTGVVAANISVASINCNALDEAVFGGTPTGEFPYGKPDTRGEFELQNRLIAARQQMQQYCQLQVARAAPVMCSAMDEAVFGGTPTGAFPYGKPATRQQFELQQLLSGTRQRIQQNCQQAQQILQQGFNNEMQQQIQD